VLGSQAIVDGDDLRVHSAGEVAVFEFKDGRVIDRQEHFQDLYARNEFSA
jgi:hypothetical protein